MCFFTHLNVPFLSLELQMVYLTFTIEVGNFLSVSIQEHTCPLKTSLCVSQMHIWGLFTLLQLGISHCVGAKLSKLEPDFVDSFALVYYAPPAVWGTNIPLKGSLKHFLDDLHLVFQTKLKEVLILFRKT